MRAVLSAGVLRILQVARLTQPGKMSAEGATAISRWLSEAIPPAAEGTVLAPLRGASIRRKSSGGVAPLDRRLIAGAPPGLPKLSVGVAPLDRRLIAGAPPGLPKPVTDLFVAQVYV